MADKSLLRMSARELVRLIASREISPIEVLDAYLAAIEAHNPKINAIVTLAAEQARDAARRAEHAVTKGDALGALHGLPIGVKDITPTAGIRTTYASPLYKDYVPTEDAEAVRRLKAAGTIVLAKTNTPEFGAGANTTNVLFGPTRNPWNTALSVAGSSGGAAAAVAAGMLPIAQGTDFGGSVRVPAAFCGIFGIRATPGLVPSYPLHLPWDFGQVHGPLARDAEDAALFLDTLTGFSRVSPISVAPPWQSAAAALKRAGDIKGLRVAYVSDIAGIGVEPEVDAICRDAVAALQNLGAEVEQIEFDVSTGRAAYQTWRGFWMVGQQYQRLSQLGEFGPNLRGNVEAGLKLTALDYAAAEHLREEIFHRFRKLFERFDLLLTPAAPVKPFPVEMNFPDTINGRKLDNYIDWIAPAYLIT
jgi:amidase